MSSVLAGLSAAGQTTPAQPPADPTVRVTLPSVNVTAQKEPEDARKLPVSVTAVSADTIERAGIRIVSDAAIFAPNIYLHRFHRPQAEQPAVPRHRLEPGQSRRHDLRRRRAPAQPNSSSVELLDVEQIEFVRGPQSALFGRNTLGGLSTSPARARRSTDGRAASPVPFGNFGIATCAARCRARSCRHAGGRASRSVTPNATASRSTRHRQRSRLARRRSGKAQLLWTPARQLGDARHRQRRARARRRLRAQRPRGASREPLRRRRATSKAAPTATFSARPSSTEHTGSASRSRRRPGSCSWKTEDSTDLDYSPLPLITRDNNEEDFQFTQEVRFARPPPRAEAVATRRRSDGRRASFLFTQNYDQVAINSFAPFVAVAVRAVPGRQTSPVPSSTTSASASTARAR